MWSNFKWFIAFIWLDFFFKKNEQTQIEIKELHMERVILKTFVLKSPNIIVG